MSTNYSEYLFIGGPADGKRVPLPQVVSCFHYPVIQGSDSSELNYINYALYRPERFRGGDEEFIVYAEEKLTLGQLVRALIERYPAS